MLSTAVVKMNDTEFDDWSAYGSMKDNAAELDTQVAIADGLFFGGIFWMTSASLAAIIWKGRIISSHNNEKFRVLNMNLCGQLG